MKYDVILTNKFKKDYKLVVKRGCNIKVLDKVINILANGEQMPEKYQDHSLSGDFEGYRECHLKPDWLLIYKVVEDALVLSLTRTGTHSDLFR